MLKYWHHCDLLCSRLHACRLARGIKGRGFASSVEPEESGTDEDSASAEKLVAGKNKTSVYQSPFWVSCSCSLVTTLLWWLRLVRFGIAEDARGAEASLSCGERSKGDGGADDTRNEGRHCDNQKYFGLIEIVVALFVWLNPEL